MRVENLRLRYTQLFLLGLLLAVAFVVFQSLSGGIELFEKNIWKRDTLISGFTRVRWALGDRVYSQGLRGKDDWLEYSKDGNLDNYQNAKPASTEDLEKIREKIRRLYQQLRQRNITLLIVVIPNKATIYPDKLSDEIQKLGPESHLDQLRTYLKQNGPAVLLDLRPTLQAGRKKQDVFYRTNTHWNPYGAFLGYTKIIQTLSNTYPQLQPKKLSEFKIKQGRQYLHDIPKLIGATNVLESGFEFILKQDDVQWGEKLNNDKIVPMQVGTTPKTDAPSLLFYGDSFSTGIKNMISQHFSKTTFIQNSSLQLDILSMQQVDKTKPDIVIIEFVERSAYNGYLDRLLSLMLGVKKN
jgi:predicted outer membrane lipoprotein